MDLRLILTIFLLHPIFSSEQEISDEEDENFLLIFPVLDYEGNCIFQENIDTPVAETPLSENNTNLDVENHAHPVEIVAPKDESFPVQALESKESSCVISAPPIDLPALVLDPPKITPTPITPQGTFQKAIARRKVRFK